MVSVPKELLETIQYALNAIPNQKNVGKKGESSYDIASALGKILNKQK